MLKETLKKFDEKWKEVMQNSDDYGDREVGGVSAQQIRKFLADEIEKALEYVINELKTNQIDRSVKLPFDVDDMVTRAMNIGWNNCVAETRQLINRYRTE